MKYFKRIAVAVFEIIIVCSLFSSCNMLPSANGIQKFPIANENEINLIQFEKPEIGEEIAVVETEFGKIKFRLFPNESPRAVENFKALVNENYYDKDNRVFKITTNRAFLISDKDGNGKTAINNGEPFENQYSDNLWHFSGAVSSISKKAGFGDSRFSFIGNAKIDEKKFPEMEKLNFPNKVIEKYKEVGGTPELDRGCNIFGQIFQGMEVVDKITSMETDEKGLPIDRINIKSIYLEKYN